MRKSKMKGDFEKLIIMYVLVIFLFIFLPAEGQHVLADQAAAGPEKTSDLEDEALEREYYELAGDKLHIDYQQGYILAEGEAVFSRGETEIRASEIEYFLGTGDIYAQGDPVTLHTGDEIIEGESLTYNYYSEEGELVSARSHINDVHIEGKVFKIVSEKDHAAELENAMVTPCAHPDPHYRFEPEVMKVFPGEKIEAQRVDVLWGDTRVFYLPSYTIEYDEDEDEGERTESVIRELTYDREEGVLAEIKYPYHREDLTEGVIYFDNTEGDVRDVMFENAFTPADAVLLETYYNEHVDDDDDEWLESYGGRLGLQVGEKISTHAGYDYEDDEGEIEEDRYVGWRRDLRDDLWMRQRYTVSDEWDEIEDNDDVYRERPIVTTLNYSPPGRNQRFDLHYDFELEEWRQEYTHNEYLTDEFTVDFYHDYRDGDLDRDEYQLTYDTERTNTSLRYRRGFDEEYLPYVETELELTPNSSLRAGYGRKVDEEKEARQLDIEPAWGDSLKVTDDLTLYADLSLRHINYTDLPENDYYQEAYSDIRLNYSHQGDNYHSDITLGREEVNTRGESYFDLDDDEDEELLYSLQASTFYETDEDLREGIQLETKLEYDDLEGDWESQLLGIRNQRDCFSYHVGYDFSDDSYRFGIDFFGAAPEGIRKIF